MDYRIQKEKEFHNKLFKEGVGRGNVEKYYKITLASRTFYKNLLQSLCVNKTVLEYGCATGSYVAFLAKEGARAVGIDISAEAIKKAKHALMGLPSEKTSFYVMNAEELGFDNDSFDMVCGGGILHHLDLHKAFKEMARVLKPNGMAIFIEPLGHNPFIKFYRKLTPHIRTADEHPLLMSDIELAKIYFNNIDLNFYYLLSLVASPFHQMKIFNHLVKILKNFDNLLFRLFPIIKKYAWQAIIIFSSKK